MFTALQGLRSIPYRDLDLTSNSTVVGYTRHCVIYQTDYCGIPVTVKRLVPPGNPKTRTLFSLNSTNRVSPSTSLDAVHPMALTPGLLRCSSIGPVGPMMLARTPSQRLLPAEDWALSDPPLSMHRAGQNWKRLSTFFKAAKAALEQFASRILSGQYFRQIHQRRRVSLLQLIALLGPLT